jgi:hypothetical protein
MKTRIYVIACSSALFLSAAAPGADWITAPSRYTHDPQTGERVDQYTPIGPVYTFARTDFMRSGYRHTASNLRVGRNADHMHIVEEWGRPVRPYGEWQFPFRPYSVPYSLWGPPFGGLGDSGWGSSSGWGPGPMPGPDMEGEADPYGRQPPPPYQDGRNGPSRMQGPASGDPRGFMQPGARGRTGPGREDLND